MCGQKSTRKKTRGFVVDHRIKPEVNNKTNTLCFISWPIKEPETIVFLARSHTFPCFRWKKCFLLPWLALLQYGESRGHYWVQSVFSIQNIQIRVNQIQVAVVHADTNLIQRSLYMVHHRWTINLSSLFVFIGLAWPTFMASSSLPWLL